MLTKMEDLLKLIKDSTEAMLADMAKNIFDGNKSAGVRARKMSREIEKLLKRYRKESVQ